MDQSSPSQEVEQVTDDDVLFGRGKGIHIHEGNIRFRKLVIERAPKYLECTESNQSREETDRHHSRKELALEIVDAIQKNGGRFLKPKEKGDRETGQKWEIVDSLASIGKVKQALRDAAARLSRDKALDLQKTSPSIASSSVDPLSSGIFDVAARPNIPQLSSNRFATNASQLGQLQAASRYQQEQALATLALQQQLERSRTIQYLEAQQRQQQSAAAAAAAANSMMMRPDIAAMLVNAARTSNSQGPPFPPNLAGQVPGFSQLQQALLPAAFAAGLVGSFRDTATVPSIPYAQARVARNVGESDDQCSSESSASRSRKSSVSESSECDEPKKKRSRRR